MGKRILAGALLVISLAFVVFLLVQAHNSREKERQRAELREIYNNAMVVAANEVESVKEPDPNADLPYYPIELFMEGQFNNEYTRAEVIEIAATVCVEARGNSDKLQRAVASVIINRKNYPGYPDTIHGVIHQHGQYAGAISGTMQKYVDIYNGEEISEEEFLMYERVLENVEYVLENGPTIPEKCTYQSGFAQGSGVYDVIDGEVISYE